MKTRTIKKDELLEKWFLVNTEGKRLGRVATLIASLLVGKSDTIKADYLFHKNKVVVINSSKIDIHPRKRMQKKYYHHSGYPGGIKEMSYEKMLELKPNEIIRLAVKGMLPKTRHQDRLLANLYIYKDENHKHIANNPVLVEE